MIGTPNNLDILLHYYCSTEPHPRLNAPAVKEGLTYLQANGLIDRADFPKVTDKGIAYLDHLLKVPFPVQRWEIPSTE